MRTVQVQLLNSLIEGKRIVNVPLRQLFAQCSIETVESASKSPFELKISSMLV